MLSPTESELADLNGMGLADPEVKGVVDPVGRGLGAGGAVTSAAGGVKGGSRKAESSGCISLPEPPGKPCETLLVVWTEVRLAGGVKANPFWLSQLACLSCGNMRTASFEVAACPD